MEQFHSWAQDLIEHASDADYRKDEDPDEGPRHYLDVDNYPEFISQGRIPQTYDSVVAKYGISFVIDQGVLPWATKNSYDSLVSTMARFDWEKAVLFAADLGHYVADGHMPLHITRNYNGQFSGNSGIHSRYESTMINAYQGQIVYPGHEIAAVEEVQDYIFDYLYDNYLYVDSVLLADDYARALAGNTSSATYKAALWEKTGDFTILLFSRASHTLAELIYSAWTEAGKPDMNSGPGIFEPKGVKHDFKLSLNPNPMKDSARIAFELEKESKVKISVMSLDGNLWSKIENKNYPAGANEMRFNSSDLPDGVYLIVLNSGKRYGTVKFIINKD
jgi:hypothetical protein